MYFTVKICFSLAILFIYTPFTKGTLPGIGGPSIDFKDWRQCKGYEGKTNINITNVLIKHGAGNSITVDCDMDVCEDFGHEEFGMLVFIERANDNPPKYEHEMKVDEDGICESLKDPDSIMSTAVHLMGFPKGQQCPIKKGVYKMRDNKIDIPAIAMAIFGRYHYWRVIIKFITGKDLEDPDAKCEMCLEAYLERVLGAAKEKKQRKWGR